MGGEDLKWANASSEVREGNFALYSILKRYAQL
jgi:hypothetical protein